MCPLVCETGLTSGVCVCARLCERDHKAGRAMETGLISPSHKKNPTNTSGLAGRIFSGLGGQKECIVLPPMTVMFHT